MDVFLSPDLEEKLQLGWIEGEGHQVRPTPEALVSEGNRLGAELRERYGGASPGEIDGVVSARALWRALGIDPTNRGPQAPTKAFAYYLSSAAPGGGGGRHTVLRPKELSAGLRAGHLFRDSSVYEMAIAEGDGTCVYELRLPFAELGGVQPGVGGKFALAIQLNDGDGEGVAAHMNWGEGMSPAWRPADFGVVTLVE